MDKKKSFAQNIKEEAETALERSKAKAQVAKGVVKEAVGKATGNDRLSAEGAAQELKGEAQQALGRELDQVWLAQPAGSDQIAADGEEC